MNECARERMSDRLSAGVRANGRKRERVCECICKFIRVCVPICDIRPRCCFMPLVNQVDIRKYNELKTGKRKTSYVSKCIYQEFGRRISIKSVVCYPGIPRL